MNSTIVRSTLVATALLLCAAPALAADSKPGIGTETKAVSTPNAADSKAKAKDAKAAKKAKVVDINSAGKAELKTLPGVGDAEADKIIAGRPYLTKAHLVTHKILPIGVYEGLKDKVIAKQNKATEAKLRELQKAR